MEKRLQAALATKSAVQKHGSRRYADPPIRFCPGHFVAFLGRSYPAHITALLRKDFQRICHETQFDPPQFYYTNSGGLPKLPHILWQSLSFGLLRGRWFSDNVAIAARKVSVST